MKKYIRDTQGKSFRQRARRIIDAATCSIRLLEPDTVMTEVEIITAHEKHDEFHGGEGFSYSDDQIRKGLADLCRVGAVKEIETIET